MRYAHLAAGAKAPTTRFSGHSCAVELKPLLICHKAYNGWFLRHSMKIIYAQINADNNVLARRGCFLGPALLLPLQDYQSEFYLQDF